MEYKPFFNSSVSHRSVESKKSGLVEREKFTGLKQTVTQIKKNANVTTLNTAAGLFTATYQSF